MATPQSLGGQATAKKLRREALKRYYANPSICEQCSSDIVVYKGQKVREARRKRFCNRSCAAKYNNARKPKHKKKRRKVKRDRHYIHKITKGELFASRAYQSARSSITRHAQRIFRESGRPRICKICGYSSHIDVCHIRPVADFPDSATLAEINSIYNLVALCPNHHWELDHNILTLQ